MNVHGGGNEKGNVRVEISNNQPCCITTHIRRLCVRELVVCAATWLILVISDGCCMITRIVLVTS